MYYLIFLVEQSSFQNLPEFVAVCKADVSQCEFAMRDVNIQVAEWQWDLRGKVLLCEKCQMQQRHTWILWGQCYCNCCPGRGSTCLKRGAKQAAVVVEGAWWGRKRCGGLCLHAERNEVCGRCPGFCLECPDILPELSFCINGVLCHITGIY